jgi:general secretion pathway protein H
LGECRGFTLIELILVLVIIGLLTSLIVPAITSLTGLNLKTATRRVAAGLRYARSQAVTTGSDYQVVLNLRKGEMTIKCLEEEEESSYWETAEDGEYQSGREEDERDEGAVDEELPPPKKKIKTYRMPKEVTLAKVIIEEVEIYPDDEEEETWIDFYPNGSCSGGEIYLTNERERVFKIALNFLTGIVKITEEEEV